MSAPSRMPTSASCSRRTTSASSTQSFMRRRGISDATSTRLRRGRAQPGARCRCRAATPTGSPSAEPTGALVRRAAASPQPHQGSRCRQSGSRPPAGTTPGRRSRSCRGRAPAGSDPRRSRARRRDDAAAAEGAILRKPLRVTNPGLTVSTRIPRGLNSAASDRESASCACFDASRPNRHHSRDGDDVDDLAFRTPRVRARKREQTRASRGS